MRITDVRVVSKGLRIGPVLVEVETDEGITGVGSTSASVSVITALIEDESDGLRRLLIGTDPTDMNMAWRRMFASGNRGRSGEGGVGVNAMGAIDMALWDIAGKAAGLPIHKLRGGAVQDRIMVYASATAFDRGHMERTGEWRHNPTEVLVKEALENKSLGFKAMKFGWGNYFSESDYDDIEAVRDAVGPDMKLMLDLGPLAYLDGTWTVKDAIHVAERLAEYDIYFLEEALHPYDVDGFEELTMQSPIRIATGESLTTVRDFQPFIERRALDIVQPDAQQMGLSQVRPCCGAGGRGGNPVYSARAVVGIPGRGAYAGAVHRDELPDDRVPGSRRGARFREGGLGRGYAREGHRDSDGGEGRLSRTSRRAGARFGQLRARGHRRVGRKIRRGRSAMTESINKVVVTWSGYRDRILKRSELEGYGHLEFLFSDDKDEIMSGLADADAAFIGPWDTDMLTAASKLRWIHAIGGGVKDYLFSEMVESKIPFTCGKPAFSIPGAGLRWERC